jgi:hypothetical protein
MEETRRRLLWHGNFLFLFVLGASAMTPLRCPLSAAR